MNGVVQYGTGTHQCDHIFHGCDARMMATLQLLRTLVCGKVILGTPYQDPENITHIKLDTHPTVYVQSLTFLNERMAVSNVDR